MPPSNNPNNRSPRRRSARRAPVSRSSPNRNASLRPTNTRNTNAYITRMGAGDRVNHILKLLRDQHRWSLKDFILALVTQPSTIDNTHSPLALAKKLASAIYHQEEVTNQLARVSSDMWDIPSGHQVARIRSELEKTAAIGLGKFDPDFEAGQMDIYNLAGRIQNAAPELSSLLLRIMERKYKLPLKDQEEDEDVPVDPSGPLVMVCAIMARSYTPRKCNNLPVIIGLHLHSMGVKRRTLEVLNGLGVTASYWVVNQSYSRVAERGKVWSFLRHEIISSLGQPYNWKRVVVCWDNFDYTQGVRHQGLDDPSMHVSATTGKVCIGRAIPHGGLRRSMIHRDVSLTTRDITTAGINTEDDILEECQRHWIAEAIRYTHGAAVESVFDHGKDQDMGPDSSTVAWPEMPVVDQIPLEVSETYTLSPILENEGTTAGTIHVMDDIFKRQLGLKPEDFQGEDLLRLAYGDQKTVSLVRTVQKERAEDQGTYDSYGWLLPLPGLFHWRLSYVSMLHDVYAGLEDAGEPSSLHHNKTMLGCVQGHHSPFHHKEEVITRAFDARVTACLYGLLPRGDAGRPDLVDSYIRTLTPETFMDKVEEVRRYMFTETGNQDPMTDSQSFNTGASPVDEQFTTHARFVQQTETYLTLKYAIRFGDVGLIKRCLTRCSLLFHGTNQTNYAFLSLYMTWLTSTDAVDKPLQDAILANSLVNTRGDRDGHYEMDRLNELLNLEFRSLVGLRRTSTINVSDLFRRAALGAGYCTDLKVGVEAAFGEHTDGRHQAKDASVAVRNLAHELHMGGSSVKQAQGRKASWVPKDILTEGSKKLLRGVRNFNSKVVANEWEEEEEPTGRPVPIGTLDEYIEEEE